MTTHIVQIVQMAMMTLHGMTFHSGTIFPCCNQGHTTDDEMNGIQKMEHHMLHSQDAQNQTDCRQKQLNE